MNEIKCPKCSTVFQVDESGYAEIVKQVRDKEFQDELTRRSSEMNKSKEQELQIIKLEDKKDFDARLAEVEKKLGEKDNEIARLKAELEIGKTKNELAITEAVKEKEQELSSKESEIAELNMKIQNKDLEFKLSEQNLKDRYENELKLKDEQIEQYKDFKAKLSTKMVGETLEQHCQNQFNSIRMTAFQNAYFEKDNDSSTGSKGDFIFRESSPDGIEFISIMFDMKNEMDTTATKHKNEDFFKELDKDRREKNCEYAVLVSLLEMDNDFYNNGIVDVSYRYPKMYVVRPQFFIPIITLLRNAALNSLQYQKELADLRNQQIDLYNFESNLNAFKESFGTSLTFANDRYNDALKGIDDAIKKLETVRDNLRKSQNRLDTANRKVEEVSIKALTKNAPSVREKLEEIRNQDEE